MRQNFLGAIQFLVVLVTGLVVGAKTTSAQTPCDFPLTIEATVPYVAVSGAVQRLLVDGSSVWVMQGGTAFRFRQIDGVWQNDSAFTYGGTSSNFDARGGRLASGSIIYSQSPANGEWLNSGSVDIGHPNPFGFKLGGIFVAAVYLGCQNCNYGLFVSPNSSLGTRTWVSGGGNYIGHLAGATTRFATASWIWNTTSYAVSIYSVSGTVNQISLSDSGGWTQNNVSYFTDFALSESLCGWVYRVQGSDELRLTVGSSACAALNDGSVFKPTWVAVNEVAAFSLGTSGSLNVPTLAEFVRTKSGSMQPGRHLAIANSGPVAAGENLIATTVASTTSPSGHVLVIIRTHPTADCDGDGVLDCEELASGTEFDMNNNNTPDSCECLADIYPDGQVNGVDLGILMSEWGSTASAVADINRDGIVSGEDMGIVLSGWGQCLN